MSAPITVIIPTLNAASAMPATADALLPGLTDGMIAELILSDGGSDDDIALVAQELGARLITGPKGRGGQLARGIAEARTPWLLLLHADTHLSPDWPEAVRSHINDAPEMAGYFRLAFRARGFWPRLISGGANLRARFLGLPYGDQGLLIHTDTLKKAGGMPDIPLMEDVALARRLKGRLTLLAATAHTSPDRYETDGWLRRATSNLGTLIRYLAGADPNKLTRRYNKRS